MAIIVTNESSLQGDPTEEAIQQALAGMDLASVQDSTTASRYAVSSVDQGNVPTLVGAQIGGNTGTQGGTNVNVIGRDSVQAVTTANLVTINLLNDALAPGNTYYYGTGPTGAKGWNTVASAMAVASSARLTDTVGANGVSTLDLATSGVAAGTYGDATHVATFTVDAYGRLTAASSTPIAVIPQGYIDGLQMVWNSATSISVTSGTAYIPSLGNVLVSNAALTLSGLALTASTWYHVYLYSNAGTPAIECMTTNPSAPYNGAARTKLGDTSRRYLGSVLTDSTGNLYQFLVEGVGDKQEMTWTAVKNTTPFRLLNAGTLGTPVTVPINFIPQIAGLVGALWVTLTLNLSASADAYAGVGQTLVNNPSAVFYGDVYIRNQNALATSTFVFQTPSKMRINGLSFQYAITAVSGTANLSVDVIAAVFLR